MKNNIIHSERGISLLITFFVMGIVLSIVLGISAILLGEIKIIRGMGYSVVAFYAGDTGIEKTLYYDRKEITVEGQRGVCGICDSCADDDCKDCTAAGAGTGCEYCTDCIVSYYTDYAGTSDKRFSVKATISSWEDDIFQSYGFYKDVSRAVEISGVEPIPVVLGPVITNASAQFSYYSGEEWEVYVSADIIDPAPDTDQILAIIQYPDDENNVETGIMQLVSGQTYTYAYQTIVPVLLEGEGAHYIDIIACNLSGQCSEAENIYP